LTAVTVADDLVTVFNKVYGHVQIGDLASLDKALQKIVTRAEREFSACGALTESRRQLLIDSVADTARPVDVCRVRADAITPSNVVLYPYLMSGDTSRVAGYASVNAMASLNK
jgi:Undecaprenyl pyrophosphate synthase